MGFNLLLLIAGNETTTNLLSNLLNYLADQAYGRGANSPTLSFPTFHRHRSEIRPGTSNLATRRQHAVHGVGGSFNMQHHPFDVANTLPSEKESA